MEGPYALSLLAGASIILMAIVKLFKAPKLDHIPTVGSTTLPGSYWAGIKFIFAGYQVIQEGYTKHKTGAFKVATLTSWLVILNRNHSEDIIKASEDSLSFYEASTHTLQTEHTLGPEIRHNHYHISLIRSQLTRNLASLFPHMRDEFTVAFSELLDLKGNEWKSVPVYSTVRKIVCRTSHRVIVGLPLCRDRDWNELGLTYMSDIFKEIMILRLIPRVLVPSLAKYVTKLTKRNSATAQYLNRIIAERRKAQGDSKEWTDKPCDFLQFLLDEGKETSVEQLAQRIMALNISSIHILAQALHHLAANPNYAQLLREEVEAVIHTDGWTKDAISKMYKVDSFLRETQRLDGFSAVPIRRRAMKDVTLSDGTIIPKGIDVCIPGHAIHHDDDVYENPETFNPFRFVNVEDEEGGGNTRNQMVAVHSEFLGFGLGKLACPGRFFAATMLKGILAHVVMSYDVKLEENATSARCEYVGTAILAHRSCNVMFRKRLN
ncbi:cytochrome P450 [Scleroderma yunnanense]